MMDLLRNINYIMAHAEAVQQPKITPAMNPLIALPLTHQQLLLRSLTTIISPESLKFNSIFEDANLSESSSDSDIEASSLRDVAASPTKALSPLRSRTAQKKAGAREECQDGLGHQEDSHLVAEEERTDLQYEATGTTQWCCKCKYSCVCNDSTCNKIPKCLSRKRVHVIAYGTLALLLLCALLYLSSSGSLVPQGRSTLESFVEETKQLGNIQTYEPRTKISSKVLLTEIKRKA